MKKMLILFGTLDLATLGVSHQHAIWIVGQLNEPTWSAGRSGKFYQSPALPLAAIVRLFSALAKQDRVMAHICPISRETTVSGSLLRVCVKCRVSAVRP